MRYLDREHYITETAYHNSNHTYNTTTSKILLLKTIIKKLNTKENKTSNILILQSTYKQINIFNKLSYEQKIDIEKNNQEFQDLVDERDQLITLLTILNPNFQDDIDTESDIDGTEHDRNEDDQFLEYLNDGILR